MINSAEKSTEMNREENIENYQHAKTMWGAVANLSALGGYSPINPIRGFTREESHMAERRCDYLGNSTRLGGHREAMAACGSNVNNGAQTGPRTRRPDRIRGIEMIDGCIRECRDALSNAERWADGDGTHKSRIAL